MTDVSRHHGNDRIGQSAIIAIVLNDECRSILPASAIRIWKFHNDDITTRH